MIYVTGDFHGDKERFKTANIKKIKKDDYLIICGDFGFLWEGTKKEIKDIKWISKRKYYTFFVDGAYENYELLEKYPLVDFAGGKARHLGGKLYHLLRGEVYMLDDKRIFTFGGGERLEMDFSEKQEAFLDGQPSTLEINNAKENLEKYNWEVDYIITHDTTTQIKSFLDIKEMQFNTLEFFLQEISEKTTFKRWFFGHTHLDKVVSPLYTAVFKNVIALDK